MLEQTFLHIPTIGMGTQQAFKRFNIRTWDDFEQKCQIIKIPETKKLKILRYIEISKQCINNNDFTFFRDNLPLNEHWRVYPYLKQKCCYLDIETTGLDKIRNSITTIGIYNGQESRVFIKGKDLDEFEQELEKYDVVVSFNGRCFDIPFLKAKYPTLKTNFFHIDLRFLLKQFGYTGGLKYIEKRMGIIRGNEISEVDGYEAVRLWYRYKSGDLEALNTLVEYNIADIENLKILMEKAYTLATNHNLI
jgi:uncharacterized protein